MIKATNINQYWNDHRFKAELTLDGVLLPIELDTTWIKELNIIDIVKFHGMKSKEEVAVFMRNCDFYVQPSFYETFGITFIEAMACGKPVIGTEIPVLQEKIGDNTGILVPTKDACALADAINYMLDNYQNYSPEIISQNIINTYSYETVGKKLNDIYIDIVRDNL